MERGRLTRKQNPRGRRTTRQFRAQPFISCLRQNLGSNSPRDRLVSPCTGSQSLLRHQRLISWVYVHSFRFSLLRLSCTVLLESTTFSLLTTATFLLRFVLRFSRAFRCLRTKTEQLKSEGRRSASRRLVQPVLLPSSLSNEACKLTVEEVPPPLADVPYPQELRRPQYRLISPQQVDWAEERKTKQGQSWNQPSRFLFKRAMC